MAACARIGGVGGPSTASPLVPLASSSQALRDAVDTVHMSSRRKRTTAVLSWAIALTLIPVSSAAAAVTEFGGLTVGAPADIATGPDGALWFTQRGVPGGIGRMTTDGSVTEYAAGATLP